MVAPAVFFAAQAGIQSVNSLLNAYFQYQQADIAERQTQIQERYLDWLADETHKKVDVEAKQLEKEGRKFLGRQKASLVAQGIALDSDVAIRLQEEAEDLISQDADRLREQAWMQVFGIKTDAQRTRAKGYMVAHNLRTQAAGSLVSGGYSAARAGLALGGFYDAQST